MKKLFLPLTLGLLSLALVACGKDEPTKAINPSERQTEPSGQFIELNSSLGSVQLQHLDKTDDLRASLHFKGINQLTRTSLSAADFGVRMTGGVAGSKINARWGIIYNGNNHYADNCQNSIASYPSDASSLTTNTIAFVNKSGSATIGGAQVRMFCKPTTTLTSISHGFMCLDGVEGTETHSTKQYFMSEQGGRQIKTDPNARIEGVTQGNIQQNRHIPIMTPVVPYTEMKRSDAGNKVKFAPRGTLMGLCLKNITGKSITIKSLVVKKDAAFDYSGYFDWSVAGKPAKFVAEYTPAQATQSALEFPVYDGASAGYVLAQNNPEIPCFYVWGFQREDRKGVPFKVQIRYQVEGTGALVTSNSFDILPLDSKVEGGKQFDDGYAYTTLLTLDGNNKSGGSQGNDWKDGGCNLPNTNPNCGNGSGNGNANVPHGPYYPHSISLGGKTPLDFVAEAPAINKAGDDFVKHFDVLLSKDFNGYDGKEVGYYTCENAKALFTSGKAFLNDYYLPSKEQWQSIMPTMVNNIHLIRFAGINEDIGDINSLKQMARVGEEPAQEYLSEYLVVRENTSLVTYAIRFEGTKWVSAWRYSMEGQVRNRKLVIKCVSMKDMGDTNLDLRLDVAKPEFFNNNPHSVRVFPCYSKVHNNKSNVNDLGRSCTLWSSDVKSGSDIWYMYIYQASVNTRWVNKSNFKLAVRPFTRKP